MAESEAKLIVGERTTSRAVLMGRSRRAASGFASLGIGEDDAVALLLRNDFAFLEATQAAQAVGAYAVPLNWHAAPGEVDYMLRDCAPKVLVAHADLLEPVRHLVPEHVKVLRVPALDGAEPPDRRDEDWDAWLAGFAEWTAAPRPPRSSWIYTSGTTGNPKGVRRLAATPEQAEKLKALFEQVYGCRPGMRGYVGGPLYHASPNAFARQGLALADLLILSTRFDPEALLRDIERHRLTTLVMVPTFFVRLLKLPEEVRRRYDVSSLESVLHTGAPCPPDVKRAMIEWWGPVLVETYGGSELGVLTFCTSQDWLAKPGTVGRAAPDATIAILDEAGRSLPPLESGEVFGRSPAYPDFTYHGRDGARAEVEAGGLITCGDVGYLDPDGYLFLNDRKRDMIISGGVNIYPAEIEAVLQACPGVADCAVFGVPDPEFGECVFAAIQPEPGATLDQDAVKSFVAARLAAFKVPRRIRFDAALPREESGKIFKRKLRDPFWAGQAARI